MNNIPGKIIFKAIVGSKAYGTFIEGKSDIDHKGVYIQDLNDILSFGYREQVNLSKDEVYYEVKRFLQLAETANPTVLELLFIPEDCVVFKDPIFDIIVKQRQKFLTKKCKDSFGGYAVAQISKARGLNKKMNWENKKIQRKEIDSFIYIVKDGITISYLKYLKTTGKKHEHFGLSKLNHVRDGYNLYYDEKLFFGGIISKNKNTLKLNRHIPKGMLPEAFLYCNTDQYTVHCKEYREYQEWLKNRNVERYVDLKNHKQKIDGKNMLHCIRLIETAKEIIETGNLNIRRPNADFLISIRKGEVELESIIELAEKQIKEIDTIFRSSNLPNEVDTKFVSDLLLEVRKKFYGI